MNKKNLTPEKVEQMKIHILLLQGHLSRYRKNAVILYGKIIKLERQVKQDAAFKALIKKKHKDIYWETIDELAEANKV